MINAFLFGIIEYLPTPLVNALLRHFALRSALEEDTVYG